MPIAIFEILSLIAAVSTALLAGTYFIFYNTVMIVLAEHDGMKMMTGINKVILNNTFLIVFLLSPLSSLLLVITGLAGGQLNVQSPALYGALLSILGFLITIRFNVPLNNQLALAMNGDKDTWEHYLVHWVKWNRRRCYASILAVMAIAVG